MGAVIAFSASPHKKEADLLPHKLVALIDSKLDEWNSFPSKKDQKHFRTHAMKRASTMAATIKNFFPDHERLSRDIVIAAAYGGTSFYEGMLQNLWTTKRAELEELNDVFLTLRDVVCFLGQPSSHARELDLRTTGWDFIFFETLRCAWRDLPSEFIDMDKHMPHLQKIDCSELGLDYAQRCFNKARNMEELPSKPLVRFDKHHN